MTFSKMASEYLKYMAVRRGCSPRSGDNYEQTFNQFTSHLRATGLDDDIRNFTPKIVEAFITALADQGRKASSVCTRLAHLSSLGRWGMKQERGKGYLLAESPVDRVERPRKLKPREKYLHATELRALLTVEAKPHEALARDMFLDTALRVSELANARVKDLRLEGDSLVLAVIVKGGRQRNVTLGREVAGRLEVSLRERQAGPEAPLLVNSRGNRWTRNMLTDMILRLAQRAGITRIVVRAHVLRHTYNALGNAAGVGLTDRAALLNHSNTQTVSNYDHFFAGQLDAAREKVRAAVAAVTAA